MTELQDRLFFSSNSIGATDNSSAGFRFGAVGTHSSRTLMLSELSIILDLLPLGFTRENCRRAIIDENCLGKPTTATRKLSFQRLTELYGLNQEIPLFRLLDRLWRLTPDARPQLALLIALARDPLLRSTSLAIAATPYGADFPRQAVAEALRTLTAGRLNESILDKVVRNCASSWTQSGYFEGRTFKRRTRVRPSYASVALALALSRLAGFRGAALFSSSWTSLLDTDPTMARELAMEAKRNGLIDLRISGDVVDMDLTRLDPVFVQIA